MSNQHEIEKSYRGLLATVFGVAHLKSDTEINRPIPEPLDITFEELLELREALLATKKPTLKSVKTN